MTAEPLLELAARVLAKHKLEAVLIGNAAAALQGSPVTTVDLDFMFRKTPTNLRKVRRIADDLGAVVMRPYYPASELYRVIRDRDGLQFDFMARVDGIRSFESLRSRATTASFGTNELRVASLEDAMRSSQVNDDPRDRTVLPVLAVRADGPATASRRPAVELPRLAKRRSTKRSALRRESDRALRDQIRRLLALPMEKRTNFLRVRRGLGSHV